MASTGTRPTSCGTSPAGCRRRSEPTPATQSSMAETPCGGLQLGDLRVNGARYSQRRTRCARDRLPRGPLRTQEQAEVDGVARETVRSALDDGGGRQVGGDVRTTPGDGNDGPGEERQRE